jgi:replicative DNA helicase
VVLSGATGVGKTNVTLDLVLSAMREEVVPVLWFSVEMGCNELWIRMVSKQSGIAPHKIETGSLTTAEYESVTTATDWLESLPIYIDDRSNINIADVVSTTRWHIAQHNVRVVVVDYAQLLGSSKADDNLYQKGGEISKNLKDLAKSGNLTAILLSQLTRGVMEGQIGGIRNVAESFKIPQDADSFISFNDKSQADIQNQGWNAGNRTIFVDKNRHGRSKISIPTMFDEVSLKSKEISLI